MVFLSEDEFIVPDKGCIFNIDVAGTPQTWWTVAAAILPKGKVISSGIKGNYWVIDAQVKVFSVPFVMEFSNTDDAVILCYKVVGEVKYAVGITVPTLTA